MTELNARLIAKASGTSGESPQSADLEVAEIAVNTADGKFFTKHTDGTIKEISGGGGGAVDSVNGQTGVVVISMDDIEDVDSLVTASAYGTSFEEGAPYPQDPIPPADLTIFYEGTRSVRFDTAVNQYGDGSHLKDIFPGNDSTLRYDVVQLYIRSNQAFTTTNRQSLGGNKQELAAGSGWTVYTRDTGFALYADGAFFEAGTKPAMVADTWYEILYVIDWANGRSTVPARWSLWVDGTIAVDSSSPGDNGVSYVAPTAPDDTRFYFSTSSVNPAAGLRYVDKLSVKSVDTLSWGLSDPTLDSNDVVSFFAAGTPSTPDKSILRYDSVEKKWKSIEHSLENVPQAGYTLQDVGGDDTKPYAYFNPTSLGEIGFSAYPTKDDEVWAVYTNAQYGLVIGRYHLDTTNGGTIANSRERANEARRTYYSDKGVIHNLGDKPLWLNGALSSYTDNTPELRWTSGNPVDSTGEYIGLKLPAGLSVNTTYTFPPAPVNGGRLRTDTDGNLTWDLSGASIDLGSPAFAVTSGISFNYEGDGTDSPTFGGNPPASMSTDSVVGNQSILFNADIADAEYLLGNYPTSPFGDPGYLWTKPFTFQTWFKDLGTDPTVYSRMIAGRDGANLANQFQIRRNGEAGPSQGAWELHHDASIVSGQTYVGDQEWHHLAIQHDGFGTYRIFLDGAIDGSAALAQPIPFDNGNGFILGGRGDLTGTLFYQGHLDATELIVGVELYDNLGFTPPTTPAGRTIVLDDRTIIDLATISDLDDVDTETTPPTDGQALVWVEADQKWQPGTVSGGSSGSIFDLTDVEKEPSTGDYSGLTNKVPGHISINSADDFVISPTSLYALPGGWSDTITVGSTITIKPADLPTIYTFTIQAIVSDWGGGVSTRYQFNEAPNSELINAAAIVVGTDKTEVEPVQGQVLVYDSTASAFRPADFDGGAVESVNGETGVVSLGIQDMDDFKPLQLPSGAPYEAGTESFPGNGLWFVNSTRLSFGGVDDNGVDQTAAITAASGSIFWSTDGASWVEVFFTGAVQGVFADSYYIDITSGTRPTNGSLIYLSFAAPGSSVDMPLAEGDILQWNDADQKFKPSQLPSGGGGAVDSVNGETGVVSLGVQDMDDFGLNSINNTSETLTDLVAGSGLVTSADKWFMSGTSLYVFPAPWMSNIQAGDTLNLQLVGGTGLFAYTVEQVIPNHNGSATTRLLFVEAVDTELDDATSGSELTVSGSTVAGSFGGTPVPLTAGDILQWDDSEQKFKPAQLPAGVDGAVDSVNGETGVVSLGIQDMDDFTLLSAPGPTWLTECGGCGVPSAGQWSEQLTHIRVDSTDSYGNSYQSGFESLQIGSPVWVSQDGVIWTESTVDYYTTFSSSNTTLFAVGVAAVPDPETYWPTAAYISPIDPTTAQIQLAEGDIIQWDEGAQKFYPVQLNGIDGGTFGSG